jgi:hypothetical protein
MEVIIEHKFENAGIDKSKMPLSDYLKKHGRESDGQRYVISELPSPMYKDVSVPTCLRCGSQYDQLVEVDLWISNGGNPDLSWFGCVTVAHRPVPELHWAYTVFSAQSSFPRVSLARCVL